MSDDSLVKRGSVIEMPLGEFSSMLLESSGMSRRIWGEFAPPTPERAAEIAKNKAEFEAAKARRTVAAEEFVAALRRRDDPVTTAMLNLHIRDADRTSWPVCNGCDFDGYEGEPPEWPCRSIEALATVHHVEIPGDL